jgi:Protein of unknown function (DUF630)/Protein of unknown function (DUF632)
MGCGSSSHRIVGFSSRAKRNRPITNSYPDPNPNPVYLCRDRTELIRSACDRRYDAAKAHVAYLRTVAALGESLRQFAVNELSTSAPGSPVLTLPASSKAKSKAGSDLDPGSGSDSSTVTPLSHSLSFEDEEGKLKPNSSTVTPLTRDLSVEEEKQTEEQPQPSTSRKLEEDSRSFPKSNKNMATATSPSRNYYPYDVYGYANGYGYDYGYGYGYGYETTNSNLNFGDEPGPSKPATPPVPVQESSGWEFFDPFTNYDQFMERYQYLNSNSNSYHSSPDLNKVRMREGIPDLEDEVKFEEKQKELEKEREEQNAIEREREKQNEIEREREKQKEIERQQQENQKEKENGDGNDNGIDPTTSVAMEKPTSISTEEGSGGKNKDVRFENEKDTKVSTSGNGPAMLVAVEIRDLHEVIEEIKEQFDCVADCAKEVADMLEVGKEQYRSGTLGCMFIVLTIPPFFYSF